MSQAPRESKIKDSFSSVQLHSLAGDTQPAEVQLESLRERRQLNENRDLWEQRRVTDSARHQGTSLEDYLEEVIDVLILSNKLVLTRSLY